jgi:hypothetical protein
MPIDFTSNNHYLQVRISHGNIYTEPGLATHSHDTLISNVGGSIDDATQIALDHALSKLQRCINIVQSGAFWNMQIVGVAKRLGNLLLDIKNLNPEQWGSLDNGIISKVLSLLNCCTVECYEFRFSSLSISKLYDGLDVCKLALQCVHRAALMYVLDYPYGAYEYFSRVGILGFRTTRGRPLHSNRKSRRPSKKWAANEAKIGAKDEATGAGDTPFSDRP